MIAINFSTAQNQFKDFCDKVTDEAEMVNAAYLEKLERGLAQVRAGKGIVKTIEELEAMAEDGV